MLQSIKLDQHYGIQLQMTIREILQEGVKEGVFTIQFARKLKKQDWRNWIQTLSDETKKEAENLFYFTEGFVEEVDEGYIEENDDPELFDRLKKLMANL